MSRKDYKAIASIIYNARYIHANKSRETAERIAGGIAVIMQEDNTNFDKAKFMNACGF